MSENTVKNAIIDYLIYRGALVLRVNSGAAVETHQGKRRFLWFVKWFALGQGNQVAGVADILALWQGRLYAIETKAIGKKGNVTEAQQLFLNEVVKHGGVGIVADSVDDIAVVMR